MQTSEIIQINPSNLSDEARRGLVEAFVLREGTDYGHHEWSLKEKTVEVERQLRDGRAYIVFDRQSERCEIITALEYQQYDNPC